MAFWKLWIQSATAVRNLNMRKLNVQEQMGLITTADAELVAAWSTGTQRVQGTGRDGLGFCKEMGLTCPLQGAQLLVTSPS